MSTVVADAPGLNLGRSMKWMFASQNWVGNLVWVFLCAMLGVVLIGNFVLLGYQLDIVQRRSRGGENENVDFDPNRFAEYLVRGLIPTAIYFLFWLAISAVTGVCISVWGAVFGLLFGKNPQDLMALLLVGPVIVLGLIDVALIFMLALPLAVRSGLANDITEGFKWKWALDTAKFMWPHMLLFLLYVFLCSFLSMFGFLICFVGIFATAAWLQLVTADLGAQMLDIYLWKGGQPISMPGETLQAEVINPYA